MSRRKSLHRELFAARQGIQRQGWALASGGGCACHPGLGLQYTVGLTRYGGHPELVVGGVCTEHGEGLLRTLATEVDGGRRLRAGECLQVVGQEVRLVDATAKAGHLVLAERLYRRRGGPPVSAMQLVLPDDEGRVVGDPDWAGRDMVLDLRSLATDVSPEGRAVLEALRSFEVVPTAGGGLQLRADGEQATQAPFLKAWLAAERDLIDAELRTCCESVRRACVTAVADGTSVAGWRLLPLAPIPPT